MVVSSVVVINRFGDNADELVTDVLCEEVTNVHDGSKIFPAEPFLSDSRFLMTDIPVARGISLPVPKSCR